MYAVIETGGAQHKVQPGDELTVQKLSVEEGAAVTFEKVLMLRNGDGVKVGTPYLDGVTVKGTVLAQGRGRKVLVFRFKRRKKYKKLQGHRQELSRVRIDEISAAGEAAPKAAVPPEAPKAAVPPEVPPPPPPRAPKAPEAPKAPATPEPPPAPAKDGGEDGA